MGVVNVTNAAEKALRRRGGDNQAADLSTLQVDICAVAVCPRWRLCVRHGADGQTGLSP